MNRNIYVLVGLLLIYLFLPQAYSKSANPIQVGFIDSFDGEISQYVLLRNDKEVPIGFFSPLFEGDRIIVKNNTLIMRLMLDGGNHLLTVSKKNSPFIIKNSAKVRTVVSNLLSWASGFFNSLHSEARKEVSVSTYGRGDNLDQISSELLSYEPLVLLSGKRNIYLDWNGGKAPYQVSISLNGNIVENIKELALQNVLIKSISLQPTEYKINIQDSENHTFSTSLTVVSKKVNLPYSIEKSKLPVDVRETLLATWLAGKNEGYWRFEAYQRVAPYAINYGNAKLLKNALKNGVDVPYFAIDR